LSFNPRARVGRDKGLQPHITGRLGFNPRARVGRDQPPLVPEYPEPPFQSTRPRGARLKERQFPITAKIVSIHAPAWGATGDVFEAIGGVVVSIHAPAWGATWPHFARVRVHIEFQSTRPRGARLRLLKLLRWSKDVSIHAPAWGATRVPVASSLPLTVSIHAPAWGATAVMVMLDQQTYVSIHAPAWGATGRLLGTRYAGLCFNPRARVGRDIFIFHNLLGILLFQSTRPRGARQAPSPLLP